MTDAKGIPFEQKQFPARSGPLEKDPFGTGMTEK
jgi:hypothetical protein